LHKECEVIFEPTLRELGVLNTEPGAQCAVMQNQLTPGHQFTPTHRDIQQNSFRGENSRKFSPFAQLQGIRNYFVCRLSFLPDNAIPPSNPYIATITRFLSPQDILRALWLPIFLPMGKNLILPLYFLVQFVYIDFVVMAQNLYSCQEGTNK